MSAQQEVRFRQGFKTLLSRFTTGKVVGAGGLAIMCALAVLSFLEGGQAVATALGSLSGLGLNILAGVIQKLYEEIWRSPGKGEQERFESLTKAIEERLSKDSAFKREVGTFLETNDVFRLAEEIVKGNPTTYGWLLTAIRQDITKYGLQLDRLHEEQKEQTALIKALAGKPRVGVVHSENDFQEWVPIVEAAAKSCFGRNSIALDLNQIIATVRSSSTATIKKTIKDEIRNCDVVVFVYSLYSYDSLSPSYLEVASDCFKRNFFFIADADFSSLVNPSAEDEQVTRQEGFLGRVEECFDTVVRFTDKDDFQCKLGDQFEKASNVPWYGLSYTITRRRWADWANAQMNEIRAKKLDDRPTLESPLWSFWEEFCSYSWLEQIQGAVSKLQRAAQPLTERKATPASAIALQNLPENLFSKNWLEIPGRLIEWCPDKTSNEIENSIKELIKKKKKRRKTKKKATTEQPNMALRQLQTELRDWQDAFSELKSLVSLPRFGRCFLVIGRSGAGKTHFVAELLSKQVSANKNVEYCCICFEEVLIRAEKTYTEWRDDFENLLLESAQLKLAGKQEIIEWKSLDALDDFLCHPRSEQTRPVKLAIIIDEFSEWIKAAPKTFLDNLKQFVEKHTYLRSFVWVFAIKETDYLYVANEEVFFSKYAIPGLPNEVSLQGWLDLDKLNVRGFSRHNKTWHERTEKYLPLKRIFEYEGLVVEEILANILRNPNGTSMKLLEIPFISWLAADWLNQPDSRILTALPNLRYIDFIERFSSNRRNKIMESGKLRTDQGVSLLDELDAVSRFLAGQLLRGIDIHNIWNLSDDISQQYKDADLNLKDSHIITCLIDLLTEYRLLEGKKATRRLGSVLIWEYGAAKELKKYLWLPNQKDTGVGGPSLLVKALPQLFGKGGKVRNYLGIFEFFLLLIENDFLLDSPHDSDTEGIQAIIGFAFSDTPDLRPGLWAAIPKTSGSFQHRFIDWLKGQILKFEDRVEFFNYLNFLRYAAADDPLDPNSGVSWDLRIKLLSCSFGCLKKWDLGTYFARYILSPLCDSIFDGEKIALSMAYLRGIEDCYSRPGEIIHEMTGVPYVDEGPFGRNEWMRIGKWSFDAISRLLVFNDPCDKLYQWSMAMVNAVLEKGESEPTSIRERDRVWACCARYILYSLVRIKKENVLPWLADLNWPVWKENPSEFGKKVFFALEEYLTLEIGKLWRVSGEADRQMCLPKLWDFAESSNPLHQQTIFYSILHSVESPRHYKVDGSVSKTGPYPRIDNELWSILEYLKEHSSSVTKGLFESTFYHEQQKYYRQ